MNDAMLAICTSIASASKPAPPEATQTTGASPDSAASASAPRNFAGALEQAAGRQSRKQDAAKPAHGKGAGGTLPPSGSTAPPASAAPTAASAPAALNVLGTGNGAPLAASSQVPVADSDSGGLAAMPATVGVGSATPSAATAGVVLTGAGGGGARGAGATAGGTGASVTGPSTTGAGTTGAGSTNAGSTDAGVGDSGASAAAPFMAAGSTDAGFTGPGPTGAGSAGAGVGVSGAGTPPGSAGAAGGTPGLAGGPITSFDSTMPGAGSASAGAGSTSPAPTNPSGAAARSQTAGADATKPGSLTAPAGVAALAASGTVMGKGQPAGNVRVSNPGSDVHSSTSAPVPPGGTGAGASALAGSALMDLAVIEGSDATGSAAAALQAAAASTPAPASAPTPDGVAATVGSPMVLPSPLTEVTVSTAGGFSAVVDTAALTASAVVSLGSGTDARGHDAADDSSGGTGSGPLPGGDGTAALQQLSTNAASSSSAAAPLPTVRVHADVDSAEFPQGVADKVSFAVDNGWSSAKLQVNPPQLGPIELQIAVQGAHAQVAMSTHSTVTREALESSVPKLRDMLSSQGFTQVSVDISQRSFQERSAPAQPYRWTGNGARDAAPVASASAQASRAPLGVLDTYA